MSEKREARDKANPNSQRHEWPDEDPLANPDSPIKSPAHLRKFLLFVIAAVAIVLISLIALVVALTTTTV